MAFKYNGLSLCLFVAIFNARALTTGTIVIICLWYDTVLVWGLNPRPPALEASTVPLGYQGDSLQGSLNGRTLL